MWSKIIESRRKEGTIRSSSEQAYDTPENHLHWQAFEISVVAQPAILLTMIVPTNFAKEKGFFQLKLRKSISYTYQYFQL